MHVCELKGGHASIHPAEQMPQICKNQQRSRTYTEMIRLGRECELEPWQLDEPDRDAARECLGIDAWLTLGHSSDIGELRPWKDISCVKKQVQSCTSA